MVLYRFSKFDGTCCISMEFDGTVSVWYVFSFGVSLLYDVVSLRYVMCVISECCFGYHAECCFGYYFGVFFMMSWWSVSSYCHYGVCFGYHFRSVIRSIASCLISIQDLVSEFMLSAFIFGSGVCVVNIHCSCLLLWLLVRHPWKLIILLFSKVSTNVGLSLLSSRLAVFVTYGGCLYCWFSQVVVFLHHWFPQAIAFVVDGVGLI